MNSEMLLRVVGIGALMLVMATGVASSCTPEAPPHTPKGIDVALTEAIRIEDQGLREEATREVLERYIADRSPRKANQALRYLLRNSRWIDLRPHEFLLSSIPGSETGSTLFGLNRLERDSREDRMAHYRRAIVEGAAEVYGYPLARERAIICASLDGLDQLLPLVREYYPQTREPFEDLYPLDGIEMGFSLRAGATDRDSAARQAISKLREFEDAEFRNRMNEERYFQRYVVSTASYVCARNPYTGDVDPACRMVLDIAIRQQCWWIEEQDRRVANGEPPMAPGPCGSHPIRWIGELASHVVDGKPFGYHFYEARRKLDSCGATD